MKFSVSSTDLSEAVTAVANAAGSNILAYSGMVLKTRSSQSIQVYSKGRDITMALTVEADVDVEGVVFLQTDGIKDYLARLPKNINVSVTASDRDLVIEPEGLGKYSFRLLTESIPELPVSRAQLVQVTPDTLSSAVRAVLHPETVTVLMESSDDSLTLTANDSYRGARALVPGAGFGPYALAVADKALTSIAACPFNSLGVVGKNRELRATGDAALVSVRLQKETPVALGSEVWARPATTTPLTIQEVLKALGRLNGLVSKSTGEKSWPVELSFSQKTLKMSISVPDVGEGSERLTLSEPVSEFECLVNLRYFENALKAHKVQGETVEMGWSSNERPLWFHNADRFGLTSIVMPARAA